MLKIEQSQEAVISLDILAEKKCRPADDPLLQNNARPVMERLVDKTAKLW